MTDIIMIEKCSKALYLFPV